MKEITLHSTISILNLSTKPQNALQRLEVETIEEFLLLDMFHVAKLKGVGQGTIEILQKNKERFLYLIDTTKRSPNIIGYDYDSIWKSLKSQLSVRTQHGLKTLSIDSLTDFLALDEQTFLSVRSIGKTSWNEVENLQRIAKIKASAIEKLSQKDLTNVSINGRIDNKKALEVVRSTLRSRARLLDKLSITSFEQLRNITKNDVLEIPGEGVIAWKKLHSAITKATKTCMAEPGITCYKKLEDFPLWKEQPISNANIPAEFFPSQNIRNVVNDPRCKEALKQLNIKTVGDALVTLPDKLLKLRNFGESSLKKLRSEIRSFIDFETNTNDKEFATQSFNDFLFFLCNNSDIPPNHGLIVVQRLTGNNNSICTLDEVAAQNNCTRERIRQIINKAFEKINNNYLNREVLNHVQIILKDLVTASGGITNIKEAVICVANEMGWKSSVSKSTFIEFLKNIPLKYQLISEGELLYTKFPCRNCEYLSSSFINIIENKFNGKIAFAQLNNCSEILCPLIPDKKCPYITPCFSKEFWREIANNLRLSFDEKYIYTKKMWALLHGGLPKKVEAVLYSSQKTMTPEEVVCILNNESGEQYDIKKIHTALINSPECVVWGRKKFIHADYANCHDEVVDYISIILTDKLSNNPFIASKGVFDEFQTTFRKNNIPNEYALCSIINLRLKKFHIDRYRYIYLSKTESSTSIDDHIEQWVLDAGEAVKRNDLETWLTDEIGTRESLVNLALNRINKIVPEKRGWLVHIDNLNIDKTKLTLICEYIDNELNQFKQLGVNKVLKNNQIYLAQLKIHNARMLYAILQYFCSDLFNFLRFPHITRLGQEISVSLSRELADYVKTQGKIVTVQECVEHFEKKGYSALQTQNRIGCLQQLLEYYPRCFIHKDTIGWNFEKDYILKNILEDAYSERISSGLLSGDLDEVFDIYEEQLPFLENDISWTGRLLASIVSQIEEVQLLGNAKRAYLLNKDFGCPFSDLGELICYVVRNHFSGGCSRADLNQWLQDNGIVKKQLTPHMVSLPEGLVLTNYECYWEDK